MPRLDNRRACRAHLARLGYPPHPPWLLRACARQARWLSWRSFLFAPAEGGAIAEQLKIKVGGVETFSNPHLSLAIEGWLYFGLFVPSEAFNAVAVSKYSSIPASECPTCSASDIQVGQLPAQMGALMFGVPVEWVWGSSTLCSCTGDGNQFSCSDGTVSYCGANEECYATMDAFVFGEWGNGCRAMQQ